MSLSKKLYQSQQKPENKAKVKIRSFSTIQAIQNTNSNVLNTSNRINTHKRLLIHERHFSQTNPSCPRLLRSEQKLRSTKNIDLKNLSVQKYNKWYIKPTKRLTYSNELKLGSSKNRSKTQGYEFYNNLYKEYITEQQNPMKDLKSRNMGNLDNISLDNIVVLEKFKEELQKTKKRVPKIVNLFIQRKFKQLQNQRKV